MFVLTPDILNQTYAKRLNWYPPVNNPEQAPAMIDGVADILDQFELILLDSYGVLCLGTTPIEGAPEAIALMRKKHKPFCVVSNDTMTNQKIAAEKYRKRGYDFTASEVLTSLDISEQFLKTITTPGRYGVIAPLEHPSNELMQGMVRLNEHNGNIPEQVENLIFLTGAGWTAKMHDSLIKSGMDRQFELHIGNPDVGAPKGGHIGATPGYFLSDFIDRTNQQATPVLYGKPDLSIFSEAFNRAGVTDPSKVLMVGDTLYTDILGGNAMGFKTLLLQSGIYAGQDIHQQIKRAGIQPHFIAPKL